MEKFKLLVIVGPTSSGKSELAVRLAKRFNGEILNADSRQIYQGMNLGTGKVAGIWKALSNARHPERSEGSLSKKVFVYKGITHHLIDFANPKRQYSAALFQRDAKKAIADVLRRAKLPIICGGTGHWIDALVYDLPLPGVKPNPRLRAELGKKTAAYLYRQLTKLDPRRAKNIDQHNKRRLIRALEIIISTKNPVPRPATRHPQLSNFHTLWLGLNPSRQVLYNKIDLRLKQRLRQGMIKEVADLHKNGLSWKRLMSFGLEYKYISLFLQKKLPREQMLTQLSFAIKHYAKRQMTWWRRNKEIKWLNNAKSVPNAIEKFIK